MCVAADLEHMLEQLVKTFLGTPRAFPPAPVLVSACSLLFDQGFKLPGRHDRALPLPSDAGSTSLRGSDAMLLKELPHLQQMHHCKSWANTRLEKLFLRRV